MPGRAPQRLVETLREALARHSDVDFAHLFGSVAKGRTREASDVDVAVHLAVPGAPGARLERGLELEGLLERAVQRSVHLTVLNDAPLELRFNVLAHGILILAHDEVARRAFYVDTGRRYYDMAPARALFRRRQAERIREGTFGG
jgi:uncharacterized protein